MSRCYVMNGVEGGVVLGGVVFRGRGSSSLFGHSLTNHQLLTPNVFGIKNYIYCVVFS